MSYYFCVENVQLGYTHGLLKHLCKNIHISLEGLVCYDVLMYTSVQYLKFAQMLKILTTLGI